MEINGQSLEATATPSVTQNINNQALRSNQDVANSYDSGGAGRGLLRDNGGFNDTLQFSNSAERDAISRRYMPQFERQSQRLKLDNLKGAQMDHLRNLQVATQAASEEVQLNRQKAILKDKIEKQQRAARGAVLGHVLGIVGGVVAGVYTAGTGTAAGFAAGEAAGNAIGGS